jgi:poly-beta-1,6 N-acetyl-D-glucosamine synthase
MPDKAPQIHPVFYDQTQRRWSWLIRFATGAFFIASSVLVFFILSIIALPLLPHNVLPKVQEMQDMGNRNPILTDRRIARREFALNREQRQLLKAIAKERRDLQKKFRYGIQPSLHPVVPANLKPIVAGFYVNWDETSRASLIRNIDHITHFFPEWFSINRAGNGIMDQRIPEDNEDITPFVRSHGVPIIPVINNYITDNVDTGQGDWDSNAIHALISIPANRLTFINKLRQLLLQEHFQGINIDFEQIPNQDRDNLTQFMQELYLAFQQVNLRVTQDVTLDQPGYDVPQLAKWNDAIIPMLYDQHSPGDGSTGGSIAGINWTQQLLAKLFKEVPPDKVVLGLGNYAYDWQKDNPGSAASLTYQSAIIQAKESQDPEDPNIGKVRMDPASLNPYYVYYDDKGKEHVVWMLDATTLYNQWDIAHRWNPRGIALWYLGAEDPSAWKIISRDDIAADQGAKIDQGLLNNISYGKQSQVDFEGEGELLEVVAQPNEGQRNVLRDSRTGLINRETYINYPSSFVVRRYGHQTKAVALTFDDGPDPVWTPQILDILKQKGVHATFFVVGESAESHPGLIARMWDEGNEIGNHSFTHPNFAITSRNRTLLEINTTQRVIESITGHSTTLFRPPYAIDVEPRTGEELRPIILASSMHLISVGEMDDPQDWNLWIKKPDGEYVRKTADDIVHDVWRDRNLGNIILLHDSGGDRSATVEALPRIIDMLRDHGYHFISLSQLRGLPRNQMFPPISNKEKILVRIDEIVFQSTYWAQTILVTLFILSIILGVFRQLMMTTLALIQLRRERKREPLLPVTGSYNPMVSVIIAAFNEEKVIEKTINAILQSDYKNLEVIVVDDGSLDNTATVVSSAFAHNDRVTSIRKKNEGKASALNLGISMSKGDIIVALDADTLFTPDTIWKLVRHFADPTVGAVSGNVKVGNPNNLLTKWQSLEYITSQNFDRRAYDLMNCITVVPGAIGAWRKEAVLQVGGYTNDTLAEDTDLTWKILRTDWRIVNDSTALAYTEVPETLGNLSKQRFRWAFGTLQNLWKHRPALFHHGAFGWVALPSLWLYQILFNAISPIMDITVIWAIFAGNFWHVAIYYFLMLGLELIGATIALWIDKSDWKLLPWLLLQRFIYRQLMYYVILKSLLTALSGISVGWNKIERHGTAKVELK